jgi:hypothetical protein
MGFFGFFFSLISSDLSGQCSRLSLSMFWFVLFVLLCCCCFAFDLLYFALLVRLFFALLVVSRTRIGYMSCCCCCRPPKSSQLARHLILNHTYALSGTDISAVPIEGQSGPNLPPWIFMTQSACTVDHGAPGPVPLRNAFGSMMCSTTRAGANLRFYTTGWTHFYRFKNDLQISRTQSPRQQTKARTRRAGGLRTTVRSRAAAL